MISNSAAKYGRKLLQINLGTNPVQSVIYNKNVIKDIQINRIQEPVLSNIKYITSFLDNTQISVSFDTINPDTNTNKTPSTLPQINQSYASGGAGNRIYANGLAKILITDAVSYLKFVIYQNDASTQKNVAMNLSGVGELILSFVSNDGSDLDVLEYPSTFTSKSNGEIVFRLSEQEAKRVLAFTNRQFRIYLINGKGEKTFLYNGRYYNQDEWLTLAETNKITSIEKRLADVTGVNTSLMVQVKNQADVLVQLNQNISNLQKQLSSDPGLLNIENSVIANQKMQIESQNESIIKLNKIVVDLNAALSLLQSNLLSDEGMMSVLQNQLNSQSIILNTDSIQGGRSSSYTESALETAKANINTSSATTFTAEGGGGKNYNSTPYSGFSGMSLKK
jgi:hypothetical protein